MNCEGKVDFEKLMAHCLELDGKSSRVLIEYFRLAASLGTSEISPTLEFLQERLKFSQKEIRTANGTLKKSGWISRRWAYERAHKRAYTTILKYESFLHSGANERANERASDVGVHTLGVKTLSGSTEAVSPPVVEVKKDVNSGAQNGDAPLVLPKPKKQPKKDPPYFRQFTDHILRTYGALKGAKYPFKVWQLDVLRGYVSNYGAATMMALWDEALLDKKITWQGHTFKAFTDELPRLQDSKTYKAKAQDYQVQLDCGGEWPDEAEMRRQIEENRKKGEIVPEVPKKTVQRASARVGGLTRLVVDESQLPKPGELDTLADPAWLKIKRKAAPAAEVSA